VPNEVHYIAAKGRSITTKYLGGREKGIAMRKNEHFGFASCVSVVHMRLKSVGVLMFVGFMLAGIFTPPIHASTFDQNFAFGPTFIPLFSTNSASRTLNVPGKQKERSIQ
jgi:hypothetical protein